MKKKKKNHLFIGYVEYVRHRNHNMPRELRNAFILKKNRG